MTCTDMGDHKTLSTYREYKKFFGGIEIMDNVFIGAKSIIMPNVKIGPSVIVGAGSIVTKDLEPGGVYAGNPVRKIGVFENVMQDRISLNELMEDYSDEQLIDRLWESFYNSK